MYKPRTFNFEPKKPKKNLQAHANAQDRDLASKVPDDIPTDARVRGGVAGAGTDDDLGWVLFDQLFQGNLVIAEDMDRGALQNQVLVDIPGEGIIVVDQDEIGRRWDRG